MTPPNQNAALDAAIEAAWKAAFPREPFQAKLFHVFKHGYLAGHADAQQERDKEIEFLQDMMGAFEWQRINALSHEEVRKELHEAGYTDGQLEAGLAKVRKAVEAAMARKAPQSQ